jgi:hypothetical protein
VVAIEAATGFAWVFFLYAAEFDGLVFEQLASKEMINAAMTEFLIMGLKISGSAQ